MKKVKSLVKEGAVIPFSPELAVTFDILGALLIQQIHYWVQASPKLKQGHKWMFNTAEELAAQIRVYGPDAIRKRLRELERAGAVHAGCFNKLGFDRTKWYRVDYGKVVQLMSERLGGRWTFNTDACGQISRMDTDKIAGPIPKNITESNSESNAMNANQILQAFQGKKQEGQTTPAKGVSSLILLWKKRLGVEGNFVKDLTGKEAGQLKLIFKALGPESSKVVDWCLQHWPSFVEGVKSAKGLSFAPEKPDVGFLAKYFEVAVPLMAPKKTIHATPPQSIAATPPKPQAKPEAAPLATSAEIAASLAELEALTGGKK